jgi:hypothetical protein
MDACDRLGMIFWAETRQLNVPEGAEIPLRELIRRNRNHPSILCWGLANIAGAGIRPKGSRPAAVMHDDDAALIARSQQGDEEALQILVGRYSDLVRYHAYRASYTVEEIDDIYKEVLARAFKGNNPFEPNADFSMWLYRIVRSVYLEKLKGRRSQPAEGDLTEYLQALNGIAHEEDPTRPTAFACEDNADANANGFAFVTDIMGYNGGGMRIDDRDHTLFPERKMLISEFSSGRGARGIYEQQLIGPVKEEILGDGRVVRQIGEYYSIYDLCRQHEKE